MSIKAPPQFNEQQNCPKQTDVVVTINRKHEHDLACRKEPIVACSECRMSFDRRLHKSTDSLEMMPNGTNKPEIPAIIEPTSSTFQKVDEEEVDFWQYFVEGTNGFVTYNVKQETGLANGTPCKSQSLSFARKDGEEEGLLQDQELFQGSDE
jgi:hypothetical protein